MGPACSYFLHAPSNTNGKLPPLLPFSSLFLILGGHILSMDSTGLILLSFCGVGPWWTKHLSNRQDSAVMLHTSSHSNCITTLGQHLDCVLSLNYSFLHTVWSAAYSANFPFPVRHPMSPHGSLQRDGTICLLLMQG